MIKLLPLKLTDYPLLIDGLVKLPDNQSQSKIRTLCRTDLYFLLRYALKRPQANNQWIFNRCREVEANPNGYLDLWAREHWKSSIVTFAKTIQDILATHGEDPIEPVEATIGIFSHTRPIAKAFLRQIKSELEKNTFLQEAFPDILYSDPQNQAPKWSEDEGICVKRSGNPKEQTVEAWGLVDGQPTSKHYNRLIYDDVVVKESVTTPEQIKKTTEGLELSFSLGTIDGIRRFVGTRYHFNDSYRTVIERGTAIPRIHPATLDGTPEGEPVLMTRDLIAQKRRDQGPYTFACQMLLNPKADEAQGFKEEWLRYYDTLGRPGNRYILFDPANGKKRANDYTCGFVLDLGFDKKIRVVDMVRDRLNLTERTALIMRWHKTYKPIRNGVRYEQYGMQADIQHIKSIMEAESYSFDITEVGGSTPKNDRIKRLIPYFERGDILLPRRYSYTNYERETRDLIHDFIHEEFLAFPVPIHDDMLDCLARILEPDLELTWPKEQEVKGNKPMGSYSHISTGWMG